MIFFLFFIVYGNVTQIGTESYPVTHTINLGYGDNNPENNPLDAMYNHLSFISLNESLKTLGGRNLVLKKNYPFKIYLTFTQDVVMNFNQISVIGGTLIENNLSTSNSKAKKEFLFTCIPNTSTEEVNINFNSAFSYNRDSLIVENLNVKFNDLVPSLTMDWWHASNPKNFLPYEGSIRVLGPNFTGINQFQYDLDQLFCDNCQLHFFNMNQIGTPFSTYNFDLYPIDPSQSSLFYLKKNFFKSFSLNSLSSLPLKFSWSDKSVALSIENLEESKVKKGNFSYYQSFDLFLNGDSKKELLDTNLTTTPRSVALQEGYSFERKKHAFNLRSKFSMSVSNNYKAGDTINLNALENASNNTGFQILSLNSMEDGTKNYYRGYFSPTQLLNNEGFFRLRIPFDFFIKNDDLFFIFAQSNNIESNFFTYLNLSIDVKKLSDTVFEIYLITPLRVVKKESFIMNSFFKSYLFTGLYLNQDSVEANNSFFLKFTIQNFNEGISSFVIDPKEVIASLIGDDLNETSFGENALTNKQEFINQFKLPTLKVFLDKLNNKFSFNVFYSESATLENILSDINYGYDNLTWHDLQF